jgi:hypothetical protein
VVANLESEIRKLCESGRATVPSGFCRQRFLRRGNPTCGQSATAADSGQMRAELTSAEIAIGGSYFDDVLRDPRRYGIENTTDKVRRPGAVRPRRDGVCTERIV